VTDVVDFSTRQDFDYGQAIARAFQAPRDHVKVLHLAPPGASSKMFIDLVQWLDPEAIGEAYL
jgi:hypothetical protein